MTKKNEFENIENIAFLTEFRLDMQFYTFQLSIDRFDHKTRYCVRYPRLPRCYRRVCGWLIGRGARDIGLHTLFFCTANATFFARQMQNISDNFGTFGKLPY